MGRKAVSVKMGISEHRQLGALARATGRTQGEVIEALVGLAERLVFIASSQFGVNRFKGGNRGLLLELVLSKDPGDIHETGELGQAVQALKDSM